MAKKILVIQGHPDPRGGHFNHALMGAYLRGATNNGFDVRSINVAALDFPLLRTKDDWETKNVPHALKSVQADISWADHIVIFFPLWLGCMPALLKGLLEQIVRPGFAVQDGRRLLEGRSARVVVTMGMPVFLFRWHFGAHGLRLLKRKILGFAGISPVRDTLIGNVEVTTDARRQKWVGRLEKLGHRGW